MSWNLAKLLLRTASEKKNSYPQNPGTVCWIPRLAAKWHKWHCCWWFDKKALKLLFCVSIHAELAANAFSCIAESSMVLARAEHQNDPQTACKHWIEVCSKKNWLEGLVVHQVFVSRTSCKGWQYMSMQSKYGGKHGNTSKASWECQASNKT